MRKMKEDWLLQKKHVDEPVTTNVQDKKIGDLFEIAERNPSGNSSVIIEFTPKTIKETQQRSSLPFGSFHRIADAMHGMSSISQVYAFSLTTRSQEQQLTSKTK